MSPEQFLYHEARLMDEMRFAEWYSLWDEDGVYWLPVRHEGDDPRRQVSIIYDDYIRIGQRVDRLASGSVLAVEQARGAMRRLISNIEVVEEGDIVRVESNFLLGIARSADQQFWMGRSIHRLRRGNEGYRIVHKKVLLNNSQREIPLLQFLI